MSLRRKATKGIVWTFTQQFGNQIIGFVISLVLARILLPEEFGLIGMIAVVLAIGNAFLDGGVTNSLIRDPDCDNEDYASVFYYQIIASLIVYLVIFITAPLVANFYDKAILTEILRLYGINVILNAFSTVQFALLTKRMNFRTQTLITIPSAIIGGIAGIYMAYDGYGVWSLVYSALITSAVKSLQMWFYSDWKPGLVFSFSKFSRHFNYGYKLTISDLLNRFFNNVFLIAIGKFFSPAQVGFYTRAETMNQLPVKNISRTLEKVTFPLFVSIQNDDKRLKNVYQRILKTIVFVLTPFMIYLGILAEPIFRFLFTEKWLPAVPYFQILCITGILYPLHSYNLDILNVKGRSDLFLKLEVIKKMLIVMALIITIPLGILAILIGQVAISLVSFFINAHYSGRFINYTAFQQLKDIFPVLLLSSVTGVILYLCDIYLVGNQMDIFRILVGGMLGITIYLFTAHLLRFDAFSGLKEILRNKNL